MRRLVSDLPGVASRNSKAIRIGAVACALATGLSGKVAVAEDEHKVAEVEGLETSSSVVPSLPETTLDRYFQEKRQEISALSSQGDLDSGAWRSKFGAFHLNRSLNKEVALFAAPVVVRGLESPSLLAELSGQPFLIVQAQVQAPPADATATAADLEVRLSTVEKQLEELEGTELNPLDLALPGISSNVPVAYGGTKGLIAVGIGYQNRIRYSDSNDDGAIAAVFGLGDPQKLGIDLQVSLLDLSRPTDDIALGFKLHRQLPDDYTIAVGGENAKVWGNSDSDASYYAVVSKKIRLKESSREAFSRLYLTAGVGTGRFRSEADVAQDRGSAGLFGSAAINVYRSSSVFAEWNGQSVGIGTSIVPFRKLPLVVTLAAADVAGSGGDGTRYTVGIGYVITR